MQYLRLPLRAKIAIELFKTFQSIQKYFGMYSHPLVSMGDWLQDIKTHHTQLLRIPKYMDTQVPYVLCLVLSSLHICGCRMLTEIIICHFSIHYNNVLKILHTILTNNLPHINSCTITYLFCFMWFSYFLNHFIL